MLYSDQIRGFHNSYIQKECILTWVLRGLNSRHLAVFFIYILALFIATVLGSGMAIFADVDSKSATFTSTVGSRVAISSKICIPVTLHGSGMAVITKGLYNVCIYVCRGIHWL